jgi:predicted phage baseplate assembly protein
VFATAYVPTAAERQGDFSAFADLLKDPDTQRQLDFPDGTIPTTRFDEVFAWRIASYQKIHTALTLANTLAYRYARNTVTIYGNVVRATHGETRSEVLGSGDGSKALQRLALRQSPLTYLAASTPAGAESTLQVRVNDILWHETASLAGLGPTERKYTTQTDDTDKTSAIFGNGEHGARLPTGVENVKASYRTGIGKSGNVKAEQISLLATRPLGVKGVFNPLRASGGADRDSRDQARRNAPLAVMALDRLVSVQDYADFARSFAGIGKASAARLSDGRREVVHVTIAGADDIPIDESLDLYRNLTQALAQCGDPFQPVEVAIRKLKLLIFSAKVRVLPDYQWESLAPKIRAALLDTFGFDRRELGQSVFLSEFISCVQGIEGVAYVDPEILDAVGEDVAVEQLAGLASTLGLNDCVEADWARINPDPAADPDARILPAELAILSPVVPDTLILTELK